MHDSQKISLNFWDTFIPPKTHEEWRDIVVDRKSKYSLNVYRVDDVEQIKDIFKWLKKDSYYAKATHNSYAYRIVQENGSILEGKNDDGEQWAGMCILRELERAESQKIFMIVTRYFGGIQLHSDRFKNVIEVCKKYFEIKNSPKS